jgi:hypothetical protein
MQSILVGKSEGKNHFGDSGIDGSIIFKWLLKKHMWQFGFMSLRIRGSGRQTFVNAVMNILIP